MKPRSRKEAIDQLEGMARATQALLSEIGNQMSNFLAFEDFFTPEEIEDLKFHHFKGESSLALADLRDVLQELRSNEGKDFTKREFKVWLVTDSFPQIKLAEVGLIEAYSYTEAQDLAKQRWNTQLLKVEEFIEDA